MIADSSSAVWTEVVAAVEHLAQSERLGITVWDALDEAIRLWAEEWFAGAGRAAARSEEDLLRISIEVLLRSVASGAIPGGQPLARVLTAALELWLAQMRDEHNQGQPFSSRTYTQVPSVRALELWQTFSEPFSPLS
ncbi:MAG: hypothetical protein R2743_02375 [Ilumatobacteraceae bacterium]